MRRISPKKDSYCSGKFSGTPDHQNRSSPFRLKPYVSPTTYSKMSQIGHVCPSIGCVDRNCADWFLNEQPTFSLSFSTVFVCWFLATAAPFCCCTKTKKNWQLKASKNIITPKMGWTPNNFLGLFCLISWILKVDHILY